MVCVAGLNPADNLNIFKQAVEQGGGGEGDQ